MPRNVAGLADVRNPIYATGVGLLLYGQEQAPPPRAGRRRR